MFASDLLTECVAVDAQFGLGEAQLVTLLRNAVVHSFQAPAAKALLLADFDAAAARLGHGHG
jgi:adenosine deaminase